MKKLFIYLVIFSFTAQTAYADCREAYQTFILDIDMGNPVPNNVKSKSRNNMTTGIAMVGPRMVVYPLWWNDAIANSCDLSTSHDQDTERIGCEAKGTWLYGTTMIFLLGNCADSYESAICGFLVGKITLNSSVS